MQNKLQQSELRLAAVNMYTLAVISFVGLVTLSAASKCCSPPQLERNEYIEGREVISGKMVPVKGTVRTAYDATNEKLMTKSAMTYGQKTVTQHVLSDYKDGYQYTVVEGVCTRVKLDGPFPAACIPDNASAGVNMYFGAGDKKLPVTQYMINDADMISSILVTQNCTPFSNTTSSTRGGIPYIVAIAHNGTTLGIADSSVFDIPPSCPHGPTQKISDVQEKQNSQVCCLPKQFESPGGIMGLLDVDGKALKQVITLTTSYDSTIKKIMTKSTSYVEKYPPTVSVELKDYANGIHYRVTNGVCKKEPLPKIFPDPCTPANGTFSPVVMGTGPHAIKGKLYNYIQEGVNMTTILTEDCVPVTDLLNGHVSSSVEFWYALGYTAMTIGIKDPSVFDVPPSCKDETNSSAPVVRMIRN